MSPTILYMYMHNHKKVSWYGEELACYSNAHVPSAGSSSGSLGTAKDTLSSGSAFLGTSGT